MPDSSLHRSVYNLLPTELERVISRVKANPLADYLEIVGDVPGAGYGDEDTPVKYVPDQHG